MKRVYLAIALTVIVILIFGFILLGSSKASDGMKTSLQGIFSTSGQLEASSASIQYYNQLSQQWQEERLRYFLIFGKTSVYELEVILGELRLNVEDGDWLNVRIQALNFMEKLDEIWSYQRIDFPTLF